jgi:ankyrin repeat protein/serine/threonine protein kinase
MATSRHDALAPSQRLSDLFTVSRFRSSRQILNLSASLDRIEAAQRASPEAGGLQAVYDVLTTLQEAAVPGPAILALKLDYIGQGGQFIVHKQLASWYSDGRMHHGEVALKQPKFDLDPSRPLRLAESPASKKSHLDAICLEVKSLTAPRLRSHPNIARLLAWTFDDASVHQPPLLLMELALCDLAQLLANKERELSAGKAYLLCAGIAAGVDAIHQEGLVHGDLKPQNILIFDVGPRGLIAKLSDFGLSVRPMEHSRSELSQGGKGAAGTRLGGTPGWRAPEVERGEFLTPRDLKRADVYAFGLTARVALSSCREILPGPEGNSEIDMDQVAGNFVQSTLPLLLAPDPSKRPERLEDLFTAAERDEGNGQEWDDASEDTEMVSHDMVAVPPMYSWELPGLPEYFLHQLAWPGGRSEPDSDLLPQMAFTVFLASTWFPQELPPSNPRREPKLHPLMSAAARGCQAARAAVPSAFAFYQKTIPGDFSPQIMPWLQSACADGSTLATRSLERLYPDALPSCRQEFERNGGYGAFYTTPPAPNSLPWIAAYGTVADLKDRCRRETHLEVNRKTADGETPLYLACVRGSWEIAAELLSYGADASIECTPLQVTCLHWLFAFDLADQYAAAERLIDAGAAIDAVVPEVVPFPHYPFRLPTGTPLHWAVATSSHAAIQALVDLGADLHKRDGVDAYFLDHRIKIVDYMGTPQNFPAPDAPVQGLTPLDYAAMEHDPFLFEHLVASMQREGGRRVVEINAADEEGMTVLHRLSADPTRTTRTGTLFSCLPFRSGGSDTAQNLRRTMVAIRKLGGDMEQLTTPQTDMIRLGTGRLSPLAMAALGGHVDVVAALLDAGGASVGAENELGLTALDQFCEDDAAAYEVARLLVAAGADVGHQNKKGNTALHGAAQRSILPVMEMLLENGVRVDEVSMDPTDLLRGRGVFALALTTRNNNPYDAAHDEAHDIQLARLLVKYALGPDVDETARRRVTENTDVDDRVLLHHYAARSMRHCVRALLQHGIQANPICMPHTHRWEGETRVRVSMRRTPLDLAVETRVRLHQSMMESRPYTLAEYESLCARCDDVVKALRDAGGCRAEELGLGEDVVIPIHMSK